MAAATLAVRAAVAAAVAALAASPPHMAPMAVPPTIFDVRCACARALCRRARLTFLA